MINFVEYVNIRLKTRFCSIITELFYSYLLNLVFNHCYFRSIVLNR